MANSNVALAVTDAEMKIYRAERSLLGAIEGVPYVRAARIALASLDPRAPMPLRIEARAVYEEAQRRALESDPVVAIHVGRLVAARREAEEAHDRRAGEERPSGSYALAGEGEG